MTNVLPGSSAASTPARLIFLALLVLMPLWIAGTTGHARFVLYCACFLLLILISAGAKPLYRPPGLLPFLLFCLWLFAQCVPLPPAFINLLMPGYAPQLHSGLWVISPDAWHPISLYPAATFAEFLRYSAYLAFYLAATNLLVSSQGQKRLLLWLSGFVGLYAFLGLVQFFSPAERIFWFFAKRPEVGRLFATYVNGNHYAALVGMVFPLLVICLLLYAPHAAYGSFRDRITDIFTDTELNRAILLALVTIVAAVSVFFSLSRSGTVCLFFSSLILLFLLFGREHLRGRMMVFLTVLVAAVGLLAFFGWDPLMERFALTFNAEGELQTQRLTYWLDSLHLLQSAPLTGSGAGTFVETYPAWQTAITRGLVVDHAHNDYLEMLTDLGLIGFGLVCWFWFAFLKSVIPAWRQRRTRSARLISAGAFAGLCSILLHSFTDFNLVIPANGLYFFMLLALFAAASHTSTQRHRGRTLLLPASDSFRKGSLLVGVLLLLLGGFYMGSGEWAVYRFASLNALDMNRATETQLKEIVETSAAVSRMAPLNPVYPFAAGMVAGLQGDVDLSLQQYKRAIWQRPFHVEYLQQAARALFAGRDKTRAETLLNSALKINPWNWTSYTELAKYYFASGRRSAGFEILKRELLLNPAQTSSVLSLLVVNGIKRTDFFYVMPARSRCWAVLGDFYLQLDDADAADRAYRRGVASTGAGEPPEAYIFWRYLQMLRQEKRNPEALALLRTALNLFPGNASFLATQGTLYEREGLPDRAIEAYRAAMLADPEREWVRKRLKRIMAERGR